MAGDGFASNPPPHRIYEAQSGLRLGSMAGLQLSVLPQSAISLELNPTSPQARTGLETGVAQIDA